MSQDYPNVERPPLGAIFHGPIEHHWSADVIEDFLILHGRDTKSNLVKRDAFISWNQWIKNLGIICHLSIGRDFRGQPFVSLVANFGMIVEPNNPKSYVRLLYYNSVLLGPVRLSLQCDNLVRLEFLSHLCHLTPAQLEFRLASFFRQAIEIREHFLSSDSGIVAIPDSEFEPNESHE